MMSKKEAMDLLGVTGKSLETDINMRYAMLVKRYHAEQNNEKLEEISTAYNIITGRYLEPIKEEPISEKRIFGKTRKQWSNIWLYGKIKYLFIFIIIIFIGYMVYTVATNTPPDYKIAVVGDFTILDEKTSETYVKGLYPEFKKIELATAFISSRTMGGYGDASYQKALILMTVSGEDLIIVDKANFQRYASLGAFKDLGDLYDSIIGMEKTKSLTLAGAKATVPIDNGGTGKDEIYGIDVSKNQLLNAIGIYGREQILTISVKTARETVTKDLITKIFKDSDQLLPKVTWIPTLAPTPTPTPTPAPSGNVTPAASTAG